MITKPLLRLLPVVFVAWLGLLALVSVFSDKAPAQVVLFPTAQFLQSLPKSTAIVGLNRWSATLISTEPHFARSLYASGAWLVLPAALLGCAPK